MIIMCKPFVPKQTKSYITRAVGVFKAWVDMRNSCSAGTVMEAFPVDLHETAYPLSVIDRNLAAFRKEG